MRSTTPKNKKKILRNIDKLQKAVAKEEKRLSKLYPEEPNRVKQEVAKYTTEHFKELGISQALEKEIGKDAVNKVETELARAASPTGFVKGMTFSAIAPKVAIKWGSAALFDAAITMGTLWYQDAQASEYYKQGTAIAAAGTAAWATESLLIYAGMTSAFTSSSVATVSSFLAPVPVIGPATLIASGVYIGVRWGVCAAWESYERKLNEEFEAECRRAERHYISHLRQEMIKRNTQQLQDLIQASPGSLRIVLPKALR